MLWFEDI